MIKLLGVSDLVTRGVTVNRLESLERLAENGHDVSTRVRHKYPRGWDIDWCDCVLFLRAATGDDLNFLKECKLRGKKIWVDTDDDLLNIPFDHQNYFTFRDETLRNAYREIHKLADHVTFSTEMLAASGLAKKWSIIPCSYPDEIVDKLTITRPVAKTIIWRGTHTHEKSLEVFGPGIIEVLRAHPDWRIEWFGHRPWRILEKVQNQWFWHDFCDVTELIQKIHNTHASVHIVPRVDDPFTQARSSVSYVEAAFAGATTVAPAWKEWQLPGALNYTDDFIAKFEQAIAEAGTQAHRDRQQAARTFIRKHRSWTATNKLHAKVLKRIMTAKGSD